MLLAVTATVALHADGDDGIVELRSGEVAARFVPAAGMLGVSLTHRGVELLALPGGIAAFRSGHTTGLPILHPWANRLSTRRFRVAGTEVDLTNVDLHADRGGLPIHGTLAGDPGWSIMRVAADDVDETARLLARFSYDRPDLLAAFPFPHDLVVEATVSSDGLRVDAAITATAGIDVPVALGWHPYFRLPDAPRSEWLLGLPERSHFELGDDGLPTGAAHPEQEERAPIADRAFDDLYALSEDRRLLLEDGRRRLVVELEAGYPYAQIYVPPGADFACLEPMTAPTNALVSGDCPIVAPGELFRATFSIRVESLADGHHP
jgi:galactose mutarotase-like enzyme